MALLVLAIGLQAVALLAQQSTHRIRRDGMPTGGQGAGQFGFRFGRPAQDIHWTTGRGGLDHLLQACHHIGIPHLDTLAPATRPPHPPWTGWRLHALQLADALADGRRRQARDAAQACDAAQPQRQCPLGGAQPRLVLIECLEEAQERRLVERARAHPFQYPPPLLKPCSCRCPKGLSSATAASSIKYISWPRCSEG